MGGSTLEVLALGARDVLTLGDLGEFLTQGIRITTHADPLSALISLRAAAPDVVIVPTELREIDPAAVVEVITADAGIPCLVAWRPGGRDHECLERCIEAGAVGLLFAEVDVPQLLSALSLARITAHALPRVHVGVLVLDLPAMALWNGSRRVDLSPVQVSLAELLVHRSPRYVSTKDLMIHLGYDGRRGALKKAIAGLRRKLDGLDLPWEAVQYSSAHGGYRLVGDVSTAMT